MFLVQKYWKINAEYYQILPVKSKKSSLSNIWDGSQTRTFYYITDAIFGFFYDYFKRNSSEIVQYWQFKSRDLNHRASGNN